MPHLLPEIRSMILGQHDDLTHLWTTCRLVSTEFKQLTEHIFMTRHLPRTTIFFPSSCEDIMCGVSLGTLQFTKPPERFHFLHFKDIDGKQKAVFASGRVRDDETAPMNCMAKLVRSDALKTMVMNSEHTVSIGKLFNDVHLPGLHADAKFETVAFDWTEFLSIFFAEEALFCRILSYLEFHAATISNTDPTSSTNPTTITAANTTQEEDQRHLKYARAVYKSVQNSSRQRFTRPGIAKVTARHIRQIHFHPRIVGHQLVEDSCYVTGESWSQMRNIMCRKLIEEEAAKAEGGSRTEARTENGRSRIGAAEVGVLRLEDFDM